MHKFNIWTDLAELVEDQLNLQVVMQFKQHHRFMLDNGLSDCNKVMDLGTGNGSFLAELAGEHPEILFVGVDDKQHMIDNATSKKKDNINWLVGDVNDPKVIAEIGDMDGILMRYLLLHLSDTPSVLAKLHRVLKDKAKLWIIDLDLEHYTCDPPHKAFDMIKQLVRRFCDEHGKDSNIGSKLVGILQKAGFKSVKREIEALNTDEIDISLLQKFIIQEVIAYRSILQNSLTDNEFDEIKSFIDDLPKSGTFLNYGVTLVSAVKG